MRIYIQCKCVHFLLFSQHTILPSIKFAAQICKAFKVLSKQIYTHKHASIIHFMLSIYLYIWWILLVLRCMKLLWKFVTQVNKLGLNKRRLEFYIFLQQTCVAQFQLDIGAFNRTANSTSFQWWLTLWNNHLWTFL